MKKIKKRCSIDNIKLSSHGELFEIYLFNTQKAILDINYPNYANEWEKEKNYKRNHYFEMEKMSP